MKQNQGKWLFVNWRLLFWTLHPTMKRPRCCLRWSRKMNQSFFLIYRVGISGMQPHQSTNASIQCTPGNVCPIWCIANIAMFAQARILHWPLHGHFLEARNFNLHYTVVPRYNEGPKDWQNMFTIKGSQISGFFSICFTIPGAKN